MEQPQTTPSVQSPRIQFQEPSFSFGSAEGRIPVGVDGRKSLRPSLTLPLTSILTQTPAGRLSLANSTNEVFIDDDPSEDWTRTTAEKDSWAHRERRRSSMWQKIDSYPSTKPLEPGSPSRFRDRRGSILSLFRHGKDKDGRDVLHSDEPDEYTQDNATAAAAIERPPSVEDKPMRGDRRGSILSMWTWGKDKSGRDVIHSGFEDDE
jgi:hypothetical protein